MMENSMENKIEILKELQLDDDENVIYKDSFKISVEDLTEILSTDIERYDDVEEFLENYDPDSDGMEVYEIAKEKGLDIEECLEDNINEENAGLNDEDIDLSEFDSLDDLDGLDEDDEEDLLG